MVKKETFAKVKEYWDYVSNEMDYSDVQMLAYYLAIEEEPPYNDKVGIIARSTKYRMTPKQRYYMYKIINERIDSYE